MELVSKNPIYAIVAIGFLIPAEKFIKKMFGLDRAESTGDFGSFAGGAVAMSALQSAKGLIGKGKGGKSSGGTSSSNDDGEQGKIFTVKRTIGNGTNLNGRGNLVGNNQNVVLNASEQQGQAGQGQITRGEQEASNNYQATAFAQAALAQGQNTGEAAVGDLEATNTVGATQPILVQGSAAPSGDTQESEENLRDLANNGKPEKLPRSRRKLVWKAAKSTGKHIYKGAKIAAVGVGGAVGAGVGASIGIATGKPSNAFQYAATGAGIGVLAGRGIGEAPETGINFVRSAANTIQGKVDGATDTKNETLYGREYARQQQIERINDRARRAFLKDEKQQAKYEEMARDVGYTGDLDNFMNAAFDMRVAGIKDEKLQKNALKLEMKRDNGQVRGKSHDGIMDVAAFANDNGYDRSYVEDAKKRESMEGVVQSMVSGEDNQMAIMNTFAALYNREDYYRQHSGIRQVTGNNTNNTMQQREATERKRSPRRSSSANNGTPTKRRGRPPRNTKN